MIQQDQQPDDPLTEVGGNSDREDNDKAPGEEKGKFDEVKPIDLKGKNVDADPSTEEGKPVEH